MIRRNIRRLYLIWHLYTHLQLMAVDEPFSIMKADEIPFNAIRHYFSQRRLMYRIDQWMNSTFDWLVGLYEVRVI